MTERKKWVEREEVIARVEDLTESRVIEGNWKHTAKESRVLSPPLSCGQGKSLVIFKKGELWSTVRPRWGAEPDPCSVTSAWQHWLVFRALSGRQLSRAHTSNLARLILLLIFFMSYTHKTVKLGQTEMNKAKDESFSNTDKWGHMLYITRCRCSALLVMSGMRLGCGFMMHHFEPLFTEVNDLH